MASRCQKCRRLFLPPRPLCINCHSNKMEWVQLKGRGKLVTFTLINVGPPWMIAQGYDRIHPYCSGVVELEEGVRIATHITGVDASKPETVKIGMPLIVEFIHHEEGENLTTRLAFKPL